MDIDLVLMNLSYLKCLNYSKAADQPHIMQSVLSRHIQNLESQLGVELLT